jgi:DHA1 family tetracycline resistance protein-like MFS transporter
MNPRKMDRRLFTILMIVFVQMLGTAMILPILPLYALEAFDMSPQVITLLSTSFFAAQFIAGPYLGRLSDTRGRVPILIISQVGTAISFIMLALAPSILFLFLARILDGITGGNIIVAQAYVTDITPREKRTVALGYVFAVFGIGFVIGPALGSLLAAAFGPRVPYIIAAGAAMLVVVLTKLTLEETVTPEQQEANREFKKESVNIVQVLKNVPLLLILSVVFLAQFGLGLLQSTFALYGEAVLFEDSDIKAVTLGIGLILAVFGLSQFITQAIILRPALRRFGEYRLIIIGNLSRVVSSIIFAALISPWYAAFAGVFYAMGSGFMMPSLQSLSTDTVDDELRGGVLGIYQSSISLSIIFSTAVAGVIFAISATLPYWLGGILGLLAFVPAIVLMRRYGRSKNESVSTTG